MTTAPAAPSPAAPSPGSPVTLPGMTREVVWRLLFGKFEFLTPMVPGMVFRIPRPESLDRMEQKISPAAGVNLHPFDESSQAEFGGIAVQGFRFGDDYWFKPLSFPQGGSER